MKQTGIPVNTQGCCFTSGGNMRLDKYLKVSRLIKRRTVANEACDAGRISVNGKVAKASQQVKAGDVLEAGDLVINKTSHVVTVKGEPVELSFKEFELLCYFVENKGIALSREKILNSVWNYDYFGDARTIDTHVKKIRSKLGDCGDYIKTIWGMGYKFEI